jgi:hypothetical protein
VWQGQQGILRRTQQGIDIKRNTFKWANWLRYWGHLHTSWKYKTERNHKEGCHLATALRLRLAVSRASLCIWGPPMRPFTVPANSTIQQLFL